MQHYISGCLSLYPGAYHYVYPGAYIINPGAYHYISGCLSLYISGCLSLGILREETTVDGTLVPETNACLSRNGQKGSCWTQRHFHRRITPGRLQGNFVAANWHQSCVFRWVCLCTQLYSFLSVCLSVSPPLPSPPTHTISHTVSLFFSFSPILSHITTEFQLSTIGALCLSLAS